MTMGEDEDKEPIILEGIGWKRRSGFGKYSTTVGIGSSWERRRFVLTPSKLSYYAVTESSSSKEETPRGSTSILTERATLTASYASDVYQPTPYSVSLKTTDVLSQTDGTKWKLCFDDRETQLIWLVAFTGIVAEASVKEYNGKVLAAEINKDAHGGFHRMYEEGDGRLLDLVHSALLSSGGGTPRNKRMTSLKNIQDEAIEVIKNSATGFHVLDDDTRSTVATSPGGASPNKTAFSFNNEDGKKEEKLPLEKLYQALVVVLLSLVYEKCSESSSAFLWQVVNIVILCICFIPPKDKEQSKGVSNNGMDTKHGKLAASPDKLSSKKSEHEGESPMKHMTKSAVATELLKAEGVPLSDMPSMRTIKDNSTPDDDQQQQKQKPERLEPLTEDEMEAHLHERWAMSAPDVDLSGEWTLIADDDFKQEYDTYLKQLGFNGITRKVACSLISRTTEITKQLHGGRELYLKGTNPKGAWERTLCCSGYPDFETHPERKEGEDYTHMKTSIKTADAEDVDAEAWWEDRGTKHRSWLRGGKKYGGGDFESLRYLQEGSNGNVLVCESIFHPSDESKKKAVVMWRFQRD